MTLQQHAPRLEQVRPPMAISNATLVTIGLVVIALLAAVAIWLVMQAGPQAPTYLDVQQQLQQLRDSTGGFI